MYFFNIIFSFSLFRVIIMRRIYKAVSVSTAMAIILSVLFMFSASAASVRYSVTGASGAKGSNVTVTVKLSSDIKIWGANVILNFNSSELAFVSSAKGGLVSGGSLNRNGSQIIFSGMYNGKSGTVFTATFKILKDSGASSLSLSSTENTDENGKTYSCTASGASVTVTKAVTGVSLNKGSVTLDKGGVSQLSATVTPSDATNRTVKYTSSNTKVAKVSSSGKITAVGGGTAKITATAGGKSAVCNVKVNVKQTGISVSGAKDRTVEEGASLKLTAARVPFDATDSYAVSWSSSDNLIATVSANGTVTGVKIGSATITAASNGWTATYNITVTEKTSESESESSSEDTTAESLASESTSAESTAAVASADNNVKKSNPIKRVFNAIFGKDGEEQKTVTKGYYYAMLVLVGVITALVSVPVTALVTSSICKNKYKKKNDEDNLFNQNRE